MADVVSLPTPRKRRIDQHARRPQPARKDDPDYWPTPHCLTSALVQFVLPALPPGPVWEAAAGEGALARAIAVTGRRILQTDLVSSPNVRRLDFLHDAPPAEAQDMVLVTNPPCSRWDAFLARGLALFDRGQIAGLVLLLRLDYLQASTRAYAFNRASFEVRCNWRPIWLPGTRPGRWSWHWVLWTGSPRRPPLYLQQSDLAQPSLPLFSGAAQPGRRRSPEGLTATQQEML
jgi:hypothetical protein